MTEGSASGINSPFSIFVLAASIVILASFVVWEINCPAPLLDFRIFKNKAFAFGNAASFANFMVLAGIDFIIPFYLELAEGLKTFQVGLFMFFYSTIYSVCAPFTGRLADDKRFGFMEGAASSLACLACILFAFTIQVPGILYVIIFITAWAIANALFIPHNKRLIFVNVPKDMQGVGSGVFNTFNNLSMIFGVCAFQAIFSAMTHSANIPDPQSMAESGWSINAVFSAFRNIFVFAGILYLVTLIFGVLAQRHAAKALR